MGKFNKCEACGSEEHWPSTVRAPAGWVQKSIAGEELFLCPECAKLFDGEQKKIRSVVRAIEKFGLIQCGHAVD